MGARYLAIVSESNSTYDWKYDVGSYGLKMKNSLEGQMVVKSATYVLWNSGAEALGNLYQVGIYCHARFYLGSIY